jgi:hypothetical protein
MFNKHYRITGPAHTCFGVRHRTTAVEKTPRANASVRRNGFFALNGKHILWQQNNPQSSRIRRQQLIVLPIVNCGKWKAKLKKSVRENRAARATSRTVTTQAGVAANNEHIKRNAMKKKETIGSPPSKKVFGNTPEKPGNIRSSKKRDTKDAISNGARQSLNHQTKK